MNKYIASIACVVAVAASALSAGAQTIITLATFNGANGDGPNGGLVHFGNTLYGTTGSGGANGFGTVFSVPATGGPITTLATFNNTTGISPASGLLLSGSTLYGTTIQGGANGYGTVFSVPVSGGPITTLATFDNSNGALPGGLVLSSGTLYGTTRGGGSLLGRVFSVPVAGGTITTLAEFNSTIGTGPIGELILLGNTLYGATSSGTVFSLPLSDGAELTRLASLNGANGSEPSGGLTLAGNTFFGNTRRGGADDLGTVFSVPVAGGTPTALWSFNGTSNGYRPTGTLALSGNTLYGTTFYGRNGPGTVFSIPVSGGTLTTLASFNGTNGANPLGALTISGNTLYGTTFAGGPVNKGTVFAIVLPCTAPVTTVSPALARCDNPNRRVEFTATASGTGPYQYRWQRRANAQSAWTNVTNGLTNCGHGAECSTVQGADTATLTIMNVEVEDVGEYQCVVSNACSTAVPSVNVATLACDCNDVIADGQSIFTEFPLPNNDLTGFFVEFRPANGMTLDEAARCCGVCGFNWVQTFTPPSHWHMYLSPRNPLFDAPLDFGTLIFSSPATTFRTFLDPTPNPSQIYSLTSDRDVPGRTHFIGGKGDGSGFYWNQGGGNNGLDHFYGRDHLNNPDTHVLLWLDRPAFANGTLDLSADERVYFTTNLVGFTCTPTCTPGCLGAGTHYQHAGFSWSTNAVYDDTQSPPVFSGGRTWFMTYLRQTEDSVLPPILSGGASGIQPIPCPLINAQPISTTACASSTAMFTATAEIGSTYQWQWQPAGAGTAWANLAAGDNAEVGGEPVVNAANVGTATLEARPLAGYINFPPRALRCVVTNACGSASSDAAVLTVCIGDYNCDEGVDGDDVIAFFGAWDASDSAGDVNHDGGVDGDDVIVFFGAWDAGC